LFLIERRSAEDGGASIPNFLCRSTMADKIGHNWRNPESYDADDGAAVDW